MERKGEKPTFFKVKCSEWLVLFIPELAAPAPEVEHEWSVLGEAGVVGVLVTEVLGGSVFQMLMMAAVL